MLRSIRRGVFETNSSSTHSITICSEEEYKSWKEGNMLYDNWNDKLIKKEDIKEESEDFQTYDEYFDDEYLEGYSEYYTTKRGDNIVAFGKYGMDN